MARGKFEYWLTEDGLTLLQGWAVDIQVENALLKRALGYDYQEEKIERLSEDSVKVTQTLKHVPADVGAVAFWLKNRRPDKWRDKPDIPADSDVLKKARALLEGIDSAID